MRNFLAGKPAVPAAAGAVWCLLNAAAPEAVPCGSSGCALYADAGLPLLWIAGAAAFGLVFALDRAGRKQAAALASAAFLACDAALLAWLVLTAPCVKCLIAGVLFFWTCACACAGIAAPALRDLRRAWILIFAAVCGLLAQESVEPWAIKGDPAAAQAAVFVSPSCPHCLNAARRWGESPHAAFLPVLERSGDFARILLARDLLAASPERSLASALEEASKASGDRLPGIFAQAWNAGLLIRCLADTARAGRAGAKMLPVVEFRGLPAGMAPKE